MTDWTFTWAFRNFIAELFMPPGILLAAILVVLFLTRRTKLKNSLIILACLALWLVSTNYFAQTLVRISQPLMQWPQALSEQDILASDAQAIVVLGGGRRKAALESYDYDQQDLSKESMERLRYAATLAKKTKLPILVTGGAPDRTEPTDLAEAVVMAKILQKEYGLEARWVEGQSATTQENAAYSAKLLQQDQMQKILLVTHFWHMPRAKKIFEQYGLQVLAAPHGFNPVKHYTPLDFYPGSIEKTRQIWHEILGQFWYYIRY
ncbi:YdcF family protein [Polynucleobacter sp. MWH-Loch1C5]|uniref:YdcF family protein n=1 Tax=Polynucleobacter sp. MWH-Loch1C5 TaxID=2689108 RepID=UPI001C0B2F62|nr:YdcF family protein [Polynucleobacter sp. MWH-Loch1C5]MBU3542224.1 YdcF family protein [Polynucleobacter sp. MWH-Loch1C5]